MAITLFGRDRPVPPSQATRLQPTADVSSRETAGVADAVAPLAGMPEPPRT
jgi:hypothetical protein